MAVSVVLVAPVQSLFIMGTGISLTPTTQQNTSNTSSLLNVSPAAAVSEINVNTNNLAAGSLSTATNIRFNYMMYVFFVQGLAGVGKDLMKISGKSITKLVNKKDDNGALFTMVVRITGAKNIVKGLGTFFGGLVLFIGYWQGACILSMFVLIPIPFMLWKVDNNLAVNIKKQPPTFRDVFTNISYNVCIILLILIPEIFFKFFEQLLKNLFLTQLIFLFLILFFGFH